MRFNHIAEDLFSSQTSIRVLRTLVQLPDRTFTGRELAAESGTPPLRALEVLRKLSALGLVRSRPSGRSIQWQLDLNHALRPPLEAWFSAERGLRKQLYEGVRAALAPLPFVRRAVIFGSVARGDERANSDIDLFVLVDHQGNKGRVEKELRILGDRVRTTFSNPLRPLIYDQEELDRKAHLAVVENIRRDGLVLVEREPIRAETLDRAKAAIYLRKAEEFGRLVQEAAAREDWNAVGLAAIHAVISACDAITTSKLGLRSRERDHEEVVKLVRRLPSRDAEERADQALRVLEVKNRVEYEARLFERTEALQTRKQAERFLSWVRRELQA